MVNPIFSEQDLAQIRAAVQAAERRTCGEIVPMVVPASGRYGEARHRTGLAAALLTLAVLMTLDYRWDLWWWSRHPAGWILVATVLAYSLGQWAGLLPGCVRLFVSDARMSLKVRRRAEEAFHRHGLHKTKEGTGVLIMISLLEHRVQVLADRAINERVPPETWDRLVAGLVEGIRAGRPTEALCQAIAICGDLLAAHFPARGGDNPDELKNDLIQET
jgi:putative membrane protein